MRLSAALTVSLALPVLGAPTLLDDQFTLYEGCHIYKVAEPNLTGGSYDLVFDGEGRVLIGDGKNLRRLEDTDGDQIYDQSEVIAEGLGGRGPQGLVVYGDKVYAVGGDGIQLFSGYLAGGKLKHERRLGAPFSTGGDHAAHTILRGLDGYIYHVSGDGGGIGDRKHITEKSSPVLFERTASVFRFDPAGEKWECIGSGGRNPPSLGMNYLGEFFSFDSDMEFHVDVPFYRPVRLHHWATGGDQGWQGVGAYPKYYLDNLPGVVDVGRGSPNWGIFYEHTQFPEMFRDAFVACDYQWKSATTGGYANPGRLLRFPLKRNGATWKSSVVLVAQPKEGAVDANGKRINFGVVDVDVAPDGSLLVSDHNQGIWRIFYDKSEKPVVPAIVPEKRASNGSLLSRLLESPQPMSEWGRMAEERFLGQDTDLHRRVQLAVLDSKRPLAQRLRAVRVVAPGFKKLHGGFLREMAEDPEPEIRGQAAWLLGIRQNKEDAGLALQLLEDEDPFVLRRAIEAQMRLQDEGAVGRLLNLLSHKDRYVAYAAMTAVAHHPTKVILENVTTEPGAIMRALVATNIRRERPKPEIVHALVTIVMDSPDSGDVLTSEVEQLDLLRILALFRGEIQQNKELTARVHRMLPTLLNSEDPKIRWEHARLCGEYDVAVAFAPILRLLEKEKDGVTQFHLAGSLAGISKGWTDAESLRLVRWLITTQDGWFAQREGKGLQFGGFWNTVVNQLAGRHTAAFIVLADQMKPESELAKVAFKAIRGAPDADKVLLKAFQAAKTDADRQRLIGLLHEVRSPLVAKQLLSDLDAAKDVERRQDLIAALAAQPLPAERADLFVMGLLEVESADAAERCAARILSDGKAFTEYGDAVKALTIGNWNGEQAVAFRLIELMTLHPQIGATLERALQTLLSHQRPSFRAPMQVIWSSGEQIADDRAWFARSFRVDGTPSEASLIITCDNEFEAFINGKKVSAHRNWEQPRKIDVSVALVEGENVIAIEGRNESGPAGLAAILQIATEKGAQTLVTDTTWKLSRAHPPKGWQSKGAAAGNWGIAVDVTGPTANVAQVMTAFIEKTPLHTSEEVLEYWQVWFRGKFGHPWFARELVKQTEVFTDANLHALIAGMKEFKGNAANGRKVYLQTACFACHGGLKGQAGSLFGPPLAGATQRLNRQELADAIVYPSKLVQDRFKATEVITTDGKTFSGFVTEQTDEFVSITDVQSQVTRLPRKQVKEIKAQEQSLMPTKLLNALKKEEIIDLMTFVHEMK